MIRSGRGHDLVSQRTRDEPGDLGDRPHRGGRVHRELGLLQRLDDLARHNLGLDRVRGPGVLDRKSTRLNSSHMSISYAVFCLKKKKKKKIIYTINKDQ